MELAHAPLRHQRVDGAARIAFRRRGARTMLADLAQRAPARVLFPDVDPQEPPQAVLLTTSGGLTGGDRLTTEAFVETGAFATFTTQAAEKLYRALPEDAATRIDQHVRVADHATAEWLGQEAILFDGARVRRRFAADVAPTGRLLAVESLVFGRGAMGEAYRTGLVHDSWRIRRDGRLIWADTLHLEGDVAAIAARPFGFGGARALATIAYVGADARDHLDTARTLVGEDRGGATCFEGLLVIRLLDADPSIVRAGVLRVAGGLRAAALGLSPRLPTVWHC